VVLKYTDNVSTLKILFKNKKPINIPGLSPRRAEFAPGPVHMKLVTNILELGEAFSYFFGFPPVNIIPQWLSAVIYRLGMNNRPVGGRSSET
jgi:hypothetical protein